MSDTTTQAPPTEPSPHLMPEHDRDREHLKLLALFWYISAALSAVLIFVGLLYGFIGGMLAATSSTGNDEQIAGVIFLIAGGAVLLLGIVASVLQVLVGRSLATQRRYVLCMVMAALVCLSIPFGTLLGVFTMIVLSRESVKARFGRIRSPA